MYVKKRKKNIIKYILHLLIASAMSASIIICTNQNELGWIIFGISIAFITMWHYRPMK